MARDRRAQITPGRQHHRERTKFQQGAECHQPNRPEDSGPRSRGSRAKSYLYGVGDQVRRVGQAGPAVTLPIFEGGRLRANLKGARADYETAVASYDETLTQALRDVADAAASERALGDRLKQSADALAADEDAYRIARLRYEGGLSNYQSVLLAEDAVLTSRRTVVDLQARAFTLDVQLVRALGGGYQTSVN